MKRVLIKVVLSVLVIVSAWVVGGGWWASRTESRTDQAWAETAEPMTAFAARFPKTAASKTALELEAVAARLGIDLAPRDAKDRAHPAEGDRKAFEAVRPSLQSFLTAQFDSGDDAIGPAPKDVAAFVSAHASELEAARGALLGDAKVAWETDRDRLFAAPVPSLAGHRGLQSLLVADALERGRTGDAKGALDAIEAGWRMNGALRERPELISQLLAIALDRALMGALRALSAVPESWPLRVMEHDYRKAMLRSVQMEAWAFSQFARREGGPVTTFVSGEVDITRTALSRWVEAPLESPYVRLCAANHSEVLRQIVVDLRNADPCSFDADAFSRKVIDSIPRWNVLGAIAIPSVGRLWKTAARISLDAELTQKVLEANVKRAASKDGAWPATLPGLDSTVCKGLKWTYVVAPDGTLSLSASRDPFPGDKGGLPLKFTGHPAKPSAKPSPRVM